VKAITGSTTWSCSRTKSSDQEPNCSDRAHLWGFLQRQYLWRRSR